MEKLFIRFTEPRIPTTRDGYEFAAIIYYKIPNLHDLGYTRKTIFGIPAQLPERFDIKDLPKVMPAFIQDAKDAAIKLIQDAELES